MTNDKMAKGYFEQAYDWYANLETLLNNKRWATVVRQSQECVELFLKGALRLVGIEPSRTHDVSLALLNAQGRFPEWFCTEVKKLAEISWRLGKDRGPSFYGDEQAGIPPQDLFNEDKARWAFESASCVMNLCRRLVGELGSGKSQD